MNTTADQVAALRPAVESDACSVAEILVEAFAEEFQIAFGSHLGEARITMAVHFRLRARATAPPGESGLAGTFVASMQQQVVGLVACATTATPQVPPFFLARALWPRIGLLGTIRAVVAMALLSGRPDIDACYVEYLAVRPQYRRKGIGTTLMHQAEDYAYSQGSERLTLEVSSRNQEALRLYQRLGFTPLPRGRGNLADRVLGMPHWLQMEKHLP